MSQIRNYNEFTNTVKLLTPFISHMVQMKQDLIFSKICLTHCFISHMVQMKQVYPHLFTICLYHFISHMVQMKLPSSV
ncbi:hypothetical protein THEYE_A2015 [Thermodesulfovibrio yellowstonii DSM 11347]|uniref:Uncharacterized protein n=1 Tax=Thermodesulfovibrio yellowstonii (strain ATCC 51303 / DSM 11347 / YP87) TaxID=289376 RepID=B5YIS8_THEYD|nr:hypothetical protein THEYE_A2015 [Thermodesulfovibrio yellowstonii DSM 11347]